MPSSSSQRLLRCFSLPLPLSSPSSSAAFLLLHRPLSSSALFSSTMPYRNREKLQRSKDSVEVADRLQRLTISDHGPLQLMGQDRGVSTASGSVDAAAGSSVVTEKEARTAERLSKLFNRPLGADFSVDGNTFSRAQIRATFYPKFENEKSDQEIRARMIEMVSHGLATLEVSLKHSGSLFMYAGHEGGAYAKNSFGNVYTAVGVFVLGRMFHEAWGAEAIRKQAEFNEFLEKNHMCISMELVTAVLGDHGQRPIDDYVVVTAVTELGSGKPKFFSTPELIAFCRKWRLPTNHVWLFSTRKSATSFFAAYDALCEEGTATPVCKALDEVADISVPGSKDHIKVQGEILEGLVARIVSRDSSNHMGEVLREFPPPPMDGIVHDLGPSLREICAANRSDEKQQIQALLQHAGTSLCPSFCDWFGNGAVGIHFRNADRSVLSKFLQVHPADFSTTKLQEMIRLMRQRHFGVAFKCYCNFHKIDSLSSDDLHFKMVIHVHNDSVFRRYQQEMRRNRGLWPLYRGFFVDIDMFKLNKEKAAELVKDSNMLLKNINGSDVSSSVSDGLADEDANLMVKLKFLTYKLRTFLIRNGLSILFKDGPSAYKTYYLRQMKNWGTSTVKQKELSKMLDEWAVYIRRKCGNRPLSSSTYLNEAEPFLEQYAKRSPQNQALIGSAGSLVSTENFLAIIDGGRDEEGDLHLDEEVIPLQPTPSAIDTVPKDEGLIVFFPGIPGCAKSALCKEILNTPGGLGDDRPIQSLMGDLIKGRYWQKVIDERKKKTSVITLADKNAPNEEVWKLIEDMCRSTKASAVPVVPDSEGTDSNPFSLDALAVFIFRVLQRANHPGNLDKASPNAGYVLLMFYHLYEGKNRKEFETELFERFGALVKMPLLKPDRNPLPEPVKVILEEGISLFRLHTDRYGRYKTEPSKGSYAKEWAQWEKRLREVLFDNADYLNSIQIPFDIAVKQVIEQLKDVAKGEHKTPETEKRKFGNIVFAAVTMPVKEINCLLNEITEKEPKVKDFLRDKDLENNLRKAHVTLAHKRSHGVTAVASYGIFEKQNVPVDVTALLFSDKSAALEVRLGSVNGEKISSKNEWPHVTLWTAAGVPPKEANALPQLLTEGKASRVEIEPPTTIAGVMDFY
ncbi:tRNA ligase phosphodiesterase domain-containing protein [Dioscorea alata]|uniref:tRNA ligase phosphodiesterase domain-containing protein n=3 Tax=Dioscorea alata TaxID=55571 RepID=A0ACB7UMX3_DIOAL|nr:tRNA ligase phosphodiesterase domain-containing protein [Dioscorea alata]